MPVGCSPFLSSLSFSFKLPPFFRSLVLFSLKHAQTASVCATSLHLMISHLFLSSLSVSCASLSAFLSLRLKRFLMFFFLRGFLKGHRGEETFSAAHACQMWCSKDDAEGEEEEDEEAVEETELKV